MSNDLLITSRSVVTAVSSMARSTSTLALAAFVTNLSCSDPTKSSAPVLDTTRNSAVAAPASPAGSVPATSTSPASPPASPLDGLALTPPMGFNDWNAFGCNVTEDLIKGTADFFVASGLKDAGYQFVNIDDCWALKDRDADGRLVPDPVKFPSGIQGVADYVHGLGLKLGVYGDAGTLTCAGYPGSLGHEPIDAQTFAAWGVDYLKYDNCSNQSDGSQQDFVHRYTAMRSALDAAGRAIVYSVCEWGQSRPWEWATGVGHLWRTTGDITDSWSSLQSIIQSNAALSNYAGPGHWNDPDMLEIGNGGMTLTEYRTHMSMWSMMAAPLIIGTDLRQASPETLAILSNAEVIALDQDPLGKQASVLSDSSGSASTVGGMVFEKPLANGDSAIALYNPSEAFAVVSVAASQTALGATSAYRLRDVWTGSETGAATRIEAGVPAHGTAVYRVSKLDDATALPPSVSVGANLDTLIGGNPQGATLTTSVSNRGTDAVQNVALSVSAPDGWTVTAATGSTGATLGSDTSDSATWNVQVPVGTNAGNYVIGLNAAYTWGSGQVASATSELSATVVVPPRDGTTPLSVLVPLSAANGSGPVEVDSSNGGQSAGDGSLITIGGKVYTRGLGTNAESKILYYLGGHCSTLTADVGIDDEVATGGSASFAIYADDRVVAQSPLLTSADPAQTLTADLTGADAVTLWTKPGDSSDGAHADWAAPNIVCGATTALTTTDRVLFSFEDGTEDWTVSTAATGGTLTQSAVFHTDGAQGLEVVSPADGNWFGKALATPLDLTGETKLAFDLKTGDTGTSGEFAVQVGVGANPAWCQGGKWTWTNPNSSRTIKTAFSEMTCPAGTTIDLTQISAVWVFVKGGTTSIRSARSSGTERKITRAAKRVLLPRQDYGDPDFSDSARPGRTAGNELSSVNPAMTSGDVPSPRQSSPTSSAPQAPNTLVSAQSALSHEQVLGPVLAAADELAGYLDTDQMLRRAVELARECIGLERVGLYVRDPRASRPLLRGTWGTGIRRETVDEHGLEHEFDPQAADQLCNLQLQGALWQHHESMLQCPQGVDGSTDLGLGWLVKTPLIAGRQLVGVMYNDAALSKTLLDELQQVRNAVLCTLLAGLFFQRRSRFPWRTITRQKSTWLIRVLRELEEDPSITGERLARQLSISPGHLGRSFKAEMGLSLVDYRNQRLLDRFLSAVERSDGNLLAAALEAGFGSYTQFHRVYKKAFGASPRAHLRARGDTPAPPPVRESAET